MKQAVSIFYIPVIISVFLSSSTIFSDGQVQAKEVIKPSQENYSLTHLKQTETQEKVRIAVLEFDFSSVSNPSLLSYFPGSSKGVSDILVTKLVQSGNFVVIERSQIEAILAEQNLGASGRIDPATAAQIGRILGVEAVIIGTVTQFDLQRKLGNYIFVQTSKTNADVTLNVRLVSTATAEIVSTVEGKGQAAHSDTVVLSVGQYTTKDGQLLTEATGIAVDQIMTALNADLDKLAALPKALPTVNAVIADVAGNIVVLNKGSTDGYRPGMRVSIERVVREIKDPQTGQVIRKLSQPIGSVELTEVDSRSSVGRIVSGSAFKVGDSARPTQ